MAQPNKINNFFKHLYRCHTCSMKIFIYTNTLLVKLCSTWRFIDSLFLLACVLDHILKQICFFCSTAIIKSFQTPMVWITNPKKVGFIFVLLIYSIIWKNSPVLVQLINMCVPAQSCLTLCNPMNCGPPASSIHGILQSKVLEWVAISSSRGSSWPRAWTQVSYISFIGRQVLYCQYHLGSSH